MDSHSVLWSDTELYRRRYEKAATALVAVERALRTRRPLRGGEDEFLELYDAFAAAPADTFTVIWEDPGAYFWVRFAYELTGACLSAEPLPPELAAFCLNLGAPDAHRALTLHLEEFKKFILAMEIISGGARRFRRPLRTRLPVSIPGTALSLMGLGTIDIVGVEAGALETIRDGRALRLESGAAVSGPTEPALIERPLVQYGELEVRLKPETLYLPTIAPAKTLLDLEAGYQAQQAPLLRAALGLVERYQPAMLEHMSRLLQVAAFKPAAAGDYSNISFSDLPGAFILSAVPDPYWMADALIHELLHNRLFFIIERGEILAGDDNRSEFYSPWRDDLRPLSGLLHAVYVYIGVARFWMAVCASGETSGIRREYAQDQAVRAVLDLRIGTAQLRRHAEFTDIGKELFAEVERDIEGLAAKMRELDLSPAAPAYTMRADGQIVPFGLSAGGRPISILESIEAHAAKFDLHRQCADLGAILELG